MQFCATNPESISTNLKIIKVKKRNCSKRTVNIYPFFARLIISFGPFLKPLETQL